MQTVAHTVTHILVRTTSGERVVDVERQRKPRVQICVNEAAAAEGVHGSQSTVPIGIMTRTRVGLPFSVAFLSRVDIRQDRAQQVAIGQPVPPRRTGKKQCSITRAVRRQKVATPSGPARVEAVTHNQTTATKKPTHRKCCVFMLV